MFSLNRPTTAAIAKQLAAADGPTMAGPRFLDLTRVLKSGREPPGFAHDYSRSLLGHGQAQFEAARIAFAHWAMFDLGWVRVANHDAVIAEGQPVAVEVRSLGLWSLNVSTIIAVLDSANQFGFIYKTTSVHVEEGEERFLLEFDPSTGEVFYELEAVSRPRTLLTRIGFPVTRHFQHRFARDSHRRMGSEALAVGQVLS